MPVVGKALKKSASFHHNTEQLRHHPTKGGRGLDTARQRLHSRLKRMATVERGRREFLARKDAVERKFSEFLASERGSALAQAEALRPEKVFVAFCEHLDDAWRLEGWHVCLQGATRSIPIFDVVLTRSTSA